MAVVTTYNWVPMVGNAFLNTSIPANQLNVELVGFADGSWQAFWEDPWTAGLRYRIMDPDSTPVGDDLNYISGGGGGHVELAAARLTNTLAITVHAHAWPGEDSDIEVMFSGSGIASAFFIGDPTRDDYAPAVTAMANGGYAITHTRDFGSGDEDVRLTIYDANHLLVSQSYVDSSALLGSGESAVAGLAGGGLVVIYRDQPVAGGDSEMRMRLYNDAGVALGAAVTIDTIGSINREPQVLALEDGGFVVAYEDNGWSLDGTEITARVYNADGSVRSNYIQVNQADTGGDQGGVSLTLLSNGFFAVGWTGGGILRAQSFDPSGARIGGEILIGASVQGDILGVNDGGVVLARQSTTSDGDGGSVRYRVDQLQRTSFADGADDLIIGDELVDLVQAGAGADQVEGFGGDDVLFGMDDNDTLIGGDGDDQLDGGAGDDIVLGGAGLDLMMGGLGNDDLYGYGDADFMNGGDGDDELNGHDGSDTLNGGANDDVIDGGVGDDVMEGGAGNDIFYVDSVGDQVTDVGGGIDKVNSFVGFSVAGTGMENVTLLGNANVNAIGGAGSNTLIGNTGANILIGGAGMDVLNGGDGIDIADYSMALAGMKAQLNTGVVSNDGDGSTDTLSNIENLTGSDFNDTLIGDGAINILRGGLGADTLIGLGGHDVLHGGTGTANTVSGGLGDDWYVLEANDSVVEAVGEGADTVEARINAYVLAANVETLIFTGVGNFNATGNAGASTITGGAGDDNLRGRGGIDVLNGGDGIDTVDYSLAAAGVTARLDTMKATNDGDGATDTFSGVENLTGSIFNDLLLGNGGNNVLMGGVGVDVLAGYGGNDILHGGPAGGNNQLIGGLGDDWYVLDAIDTCVELVGEGIDTVEARIGAYVMRENIDNLVYTGANKFVGTGNGLDNHMTGGALNDVLRGMGGSDTILGGMGNDELQVRGAKVQYTVTAEGDGWRIDDTVLGRDGTIYVESIETVRFLSGNTTTALTYPPPAPAPLETSGKETGPEVLPGLIDDKTWDDAFVLPALPDDQPMVLPGLEVEKFIDSPLVLPGTFEAAPDYFGLAAHLPPSGHWMIALDPDGGLFSPPAHGDGWL